MLVSALRGRAPLSATAEVEVPHQKAFNAYLRSGDDDGLRGLAIEEKALSVASDGGFLAAPKVAETVQNTLHSTSSLRRLANVVTIEGSVYEVLVEKGDTGAGWATEAASVETGNSQLDRIAIPVHELSAMPKASQRLLDDAAFDVEGWLAERIACQQCLMDPQELRPIPLSGIAHWHVQYGAADLGIAGKDVLIEHGGAGLYQPLDLNIAR